MKRILMIGTGGTIASALTADGLEPQMASSDICITYRIFPNFAK